MKIKGLKKKLYKFQKQGVRFLDKKKGRALIADEMGLGKTVQALAWLQLHPEIRPAVVVCPASVKLHWRKEARAWMRKIKAVVLSGRTPYKKKADIYIINYDVLYDWRHWIVKKNPECIILDECHFIKNRETQRAKGARKIAKAVPHIIGLSGTPITNRPIEMWNTISLINPKLFPSYFWFIYRYCNLKCKGGTFDKNGASNTGELHKKLVKSVMLRRLKENVLTDLPPKTRSIVPLPMRYRATYAQAEANFIEWLSKYRPHKIKRAKKALALSKLQHLKELTMEGKMPAVIDWIQDFLDTDNKLVVFCTHKKTIQILMEHFGDIAVRYEGSTTTKQRVLTVKRFAKGDSCRLFIGNLKAAGTGIDGLQGACSNVAFAEVVGTPGYHDQAEDRLHRIGQKGAVNSWYLIARRTIEEHIITVQDERRKILVDILDGKKVKKGSTLTALLSKCRKGFFTEND